MNLKEDDPMFNLMEAMTKGPSEAIRSQEKRGQGKLVESTLLPKEINSGTREQFEEVGIVFGDEAQDDDLFVQVELPEGWQKVPTDHSMWSKLVDERGRERASIFYKAAFYDRKAHMSIVRRFTPVVQPVGGDYDKPVETTPREAVVLDCGEVTWRSEPMSPSESVEWFELRDALYPKAEAWLEENYPDWENPLAYWDEAEAPND